MLVGKSSHMLHVQFAAVMPPARIARKISGPKFETIRPSMMPAHGRGQVDHRRVAGFETLHSE
jgi:hypothetical protein